MSESHQLATFGWACEQLKVGKIELLERAMLVYQQAKSEVIHHFADCLYTREVRVRAGIVAVGHYQRTRHLCIMTAGAVAMVGPDGEVREIRAPMTYIAEPGRKVGYVLDDMTWLNVYPTIEMDVETLENTYLDKSPAFMDHQAGLLQQIRHIDQADYTAALRYLAVNPDVARAQAENTADLCPFPFGSYKVKIAESSIDGRGLIATADIAAGEIIAPARINGFRTPAGRYTNHGAEPNARMARTVSGDIGLVAIRSISGCTGGQNGEEVTIDYRQAAALLQAMEKTA